jgi:hypothetical protein
VIGPALELLLAGKCGGCGRDDLRLFNVDVSRLTDYALLFRVCCYCREHLRTREGEQHAMDHWTWFCINAHSPATTSARQRAVREYGEELRAQREQEAREQEASEAGVTTAG